MIEQQGTIKGLFILFFVILTSATEAQNKWVNATGETIEQFLSEYTTHVSYSGMEKKAGIFLRDFCLKENLHITQMGDSDGNFNFAASLFPLELRKPNIILLNHIDVVHEGDSSAWQHPPFGGLIKDDIIWGRGTYDNKGMAAMQLYSLLAFKRQHETQDLPYNITILSVSCEETQCKGGAQYVVKHFLETLNPVLVLGEGPPSLNNILKSDPEKDVFAISLAHKRIVWLRLDVAIKNSGHASVTPDEYANKTMVQALSRLSERKAKFILTDLNISILKNLGKHEKGFTSFVLRHPRLFKPILKHELKEIPELYALFTNTVSITNIKSESEIFNVIPQKASAYLDCRLLPQMDQAIFMEALEKTLDSEHVSITVVNAMEKMQPSSPSTTYYKSLEKVMKKHHPNSLIIPAMMPNCNDCGIFRSHGIPAYASNLFKIEHQVLHSIHNTDEHIPIAAIKQGTSIYLDFIKEMQGLN